MNENKIKVAITDDHPIVLQGMALLLEKTDDMELTGQYANGDELMEGLKDIVPDILMLDIKLPKTKGEDLALTLSNKYPQVKVIVLTYMDSVYYAKLMMKRGVRGYLLKTSDETEVLEAILSVDKGELYIETSIKDKVLMGALGQKKEPDAEPLLTKRELEVLKLIASNCNSQQIANSLYISKKTVDNHRANMLLKMKVKNAPSLIKRAIELNLL